MVLELHTWGPAFGLPSIDSQCLAAIAYFALALPETDSAEWVLIPDSDPRVVPTNELPALRTGSRWISGFRNIVEFLKQYSNGEWDLDSWLGPKERADFVAFSSFLELNGQALIDLSLYVSSDNYHSATSPAYGTLLQWPNQWIIPPQVRSNAKARTMHLGLSALDLDYAEEMRQQGRDMNTAAAGQIPKSLATKPRQTVSGLLSKSSQKARIRLQGLTEALVEPMQQLLGKKEYLLSDDIPSSLDCLALGYLSLALVPELPFSWLRDDIQAQAPRLAAYVKKLGTRCFGEPIDAVAVLSDAYTRSASRLPWQVPQKISLGGIGLRIFEGMTDVIPVVKDIRLSRRIRQMSQDKSLDSELVIALADNHKREALTSAATVFFGLGMFVLYLFKVGYITVEKHSTAATAADDKRSTGSEGDI
ncbi:hypothetical protein PRK78_005121 [Emydomyces testavorans]|uniref:Mitochondrial import receptor subunit n=1 Tax=Emydomyces testavorans TaxID=2070801 RepID=A0AAF0DJ76_9EURO|nr:hypothetical protein PRK78_005121 [Emydomyces testavorans]